MPPILLETGGGGNSARCRRRETFHLGEFAQHRLMVEIMPMRRASSISGHQPPTPQPQATSQMEPSTSC